MDITEVVGTGLMDGRLANAVARLRRGHARVLVATETGMTRGRVANVVGGMSVVLAQHLAASLYSHGGVKSVWATKENGLSKILAPIKKIAPLENGHQDCPLYWKNTGPGPRRIRTTPICIYKSL